MDDEVDEIKKTIRFYVWSGYYDQNEVFDIVIDEVDYIEAEVERILREAIDREFRTKREIEKSWPAITDCDRLDDVFHVLQGRGILTRHRCGMTIQDGLDVIGRLYNESGDKRSELVGYCFYHLQDMEAAISGKVGLWMAFGGFPPTHEQSVLVGQLIIQEFGRVGFTIEWNGNSESRLLLKGFKWQRLGRK